MGLDPRFTSKGKGKTFALEELIPDAPDGEAEEQPPSHESPSNNQPTDVAGIPAQVEAELTRTPSPPMNDIWAQYYTQNDPTAPSLINVSQAMRCNLPGPRGEFTYGAWRPTTDAPPPILIGRGAACSAVGGKWMESWGTALTSTSRIHIDRELRYGGGPAFRSLGGINLPIAIPKGRAIDKLSRVLVFRVDVAKAATPLLISPKALTHMQGSMDFSTFAMGLPDQFAIVLTKSPTGHALPPGTINQQILPHSALDCRQVSPLRQTISELRILKDAEALKIHQQLGQCSEKQLVELLKFGGCKVDSLQIQRITSMQLSTKCAPNRSACCIKLDCSI